MRRLRFLKLNLGIKRFAAHVILRGHYAFEAVVKRMIFRHFGADYHWGNQRSQNLDIDRSSLGYGEFHKALVRNMRPKRILCVGSMHGFIPYMLAAACIENNEGHVDFVDASYDIHDKDDSSRHYFGQGFWRKVDIKKHFSHIDKDFS